MENNDLTKAGIAWTGAGGSAVLEWLGFTSWSDLAGFVAVVYTAVLIAEKVVSWWKKRKCKGNE